MPTRRAELDHVGTYNFMVEISGVNAGDSSGINEDVSNDNHISFQPQNQGFPSTQTDPNHYSGYSEFDLFVIGVILISVTFVILTFSIGIYYNYCKHKRILRNEKKLYVDDEEIEDVVINKANSECKPMIDDI